jgi:hypothetical protein
MVDVIAMLSRPTTTRPAHPSRRIALKGAFLLLAALAVTLGLLSAPAFAKLTEVEGHAFGVTPRSVEMPSNPPPPEPLRFDPAKFANNEGHAVVKSSNVSAIYWDPTDHYNSDWQHVINGFLHNVGSESGSLSNVFAVDSQYVDKSDHRGGYSIAYRGAYTDTNPYPAIPGCVDPEPLKGSDPITCVTDAQIQEELKSFIVQHSLQTGMSAIFYVLTPPGVTVCLDGGALASTCSDYERAEYALGESEVERKEKQQEEKARLEGSFCSYHGDINPSASPEGDAGTVLYAVLPWTAGGAGDFHLNPKNRTQAYDCQDGGFDPSSKPVGKKEQAKEKTAADEEAFNKMNEEEQEEQLKREELEGPHEEQPNQVECPSFDGSCDTGLADLIVNQIAVEQQNITTDPLLNAWQDPVGNEVMDECRNSFDFVSGGAVTAQELTGAGTLSNQVIGGDYYLNDTFNLAGMKLEYPGGACTNGLSLLPRFTVPNTVNVNELVGFDGMESVITLNAGVNFTPSGEALDFYATYTWDFGDGSPAVSGYAPGAPSVNSPGVSPCAAPWLTPCAASAYHSYQYGGTYQVTLTVTDIGGNTARVTEPVTVVGPPPPPPASAPAGGGSPGSGSPAASPPAQEAPATPSGVTATPPPVLGASVTSKSLKKALSGGLPVHYSTNEQVAGSIQVLLDGATAKRLGIHGATATGLPAGTPRSIVVGTAVLVTTKAGQGTIRIKFSSNAASRLKRIHKLKVTLRLFARNASRQSPKTTTLLSTVTLNR